MKLLMISNFYPPYFKGGYELRCRLHAKELARRGHEVVILTSMWKAENKVVEDGIYRLLYLKEAVQDMALLPFAIQRRIGQLKWALACRKNYRITTDIVKDFNPDAAYIWNMEDISIAPVLAVQDNSIPTVFRVNDYWLHRLRVEIGLEPNPLKRRFRAAIVGIRNWADVQFDDMLVLSNWVKQRYLEVGFAEETMTVVLGGVPASSVLEPDELQELTIDDEVRLVYAGRLVPEKGVNVALEAVAHLIKQDGRHTIHLDIIGTGPDDYVRELNDLVKKLGIEDHTEFVGFVQHQEVLKRFTTYHAALVPSLWEEPLGSAQTQAMARGLPVIASDRGGIPETISDGETGFLVPANDPQALAAAIKYVIENPEHVREIRHAALKTVRERLTIHHEVDHAEAHLLTASRRKQDDVIQVRP